MIRPEAAAFLNRWAEAVCAGAVVLVGIWLFSLGGWLMQGIGALIAVGSGAFAWAAVQRARLAPKGHGPGIVEIDEGQIAWYGPGIGGFVSVTELADIGLLTVHGLRVWRLRQGDGQLLLVPIDAEGAAGIFDALTPLPGLDLGVLLSALQGDTDRPILWRRDREKILPLRRP